MDCSPPGPSIHGIFQARVLVFQARVLVLLVSAKHQHESAIGVCKSPPSWTSLSSPSSSHPSRLSQSPCLSSLSHTANSPRLSILHMVVYMFPSFSLHSSHSLLPSSPHVCKSDLYVSVSIGEHRVLTTGPPRKSLSGTILWNRAGNQINAKSDSMAF